MEDKVIEIYDVLKSCKEGNCANCSRNPKSTNTYWCRKQLLQDCFDCFDKFLDDEIKYKKGEVRR